MKDSVRAALSEDGGVIMDLNSGLMLSLNATGCVIWETLATGHLAQIAVDKLLNLTGAGADEVRSDVKLFVQNLADQGLIEPGQRG